jgi:hypothetical protein
MESEKPPSGPKGEPERQSRKAAEAVVRCAGFQCMAYKDKNGIWHSVADDKELQVLEVVMLF